MIIVRYDVILDLSVHTLHYNHLRNCANNTYALLLKITQSLFYLGLFSLGWPGSRSVIQDHSDRGASKKPMNPLWTRILQLFWCTIIPVILDYWSWSGPSRRSTPLLIFSYYNRPSVTLILPSWGTLLHYIYQLDFLSKSVMYNTVLTHELWILSFSSILIII